MYRFISKEFNSNLVDGISTAYKTIRLKDKKLNTAYHLIFSPIIMLKQAIIVMAKEAYCIFGN